MALWMFLILGIRPSALVPQYDGTTKEPFVVRSKRRTFHAVWLGSRRETRTGAIADFDQKIHFQEEPF
jgi:hypothetical protein